MVQEATEDLAEVGEERVTLRNPAAMAVLEGAVLGPAAEGLSPV